MSCDVEPFAGPRFDASNSPSVGESEAVEMFARHFEALHRNGAPAKAKQQAEIPNTGRRL